MAVVSRARKRSTIEDYLAAQAQAPIENLFLALHAALRGRSSRPHGSEKRFRDPAFRRVRYPDGMVTCGPVPFDGADPEAITNPTVIFEALSASTANIDRGEKSEQYRATPSVQAIVFLDSRRRHCESLSRNDDGSWVLRVHEGVRPLPCIGVELAMDALYEGVLDGAEGPAD